MRAEIVLAALGVLSGFVFYFLNRRHKRREEREKNARLGAIRKDLADAAYEAYRSITGAFGINRIHGSDGARPNVFYIDQSAIDLTAWEDYAMQYQPLADPVEYRFARQLFDQLRSVVEAPLPHGIQRGTPSTFAHVGDWVEGCQTMAIPMTECHAIGADLFRKIADYLDLVEDGRTINLDYFPHIWIPHPYNDQWAIPYDWKELYATGYYQHYNEPDGRAKPIPTAHSRLATA